MKKLIIFLFIGIFLLSLASAQIETKYYIYQNKVLAEYDFESVLNLELRIPYDAKNLQINSEYELKDFENYKILKINSAENLSVKYITESMIDKSKKGYYFTSKNYLNETQKVKLVLSESAVLVEDGLVFPEPDLITSDGRSIILKWDTYNEKQILVDYEFPKSKVFIWYLIVLILVLIFIGYLVFQRRIFKKEIEKIKKKTGKNKSKKTREQKKELLTKNLFEEEKKIVEYLLDKKGNEAWTKEILRDVGISKVKLSRKLRSLEQKGIIKKIPYGNTNKIRVLKK